MVQQTKDKKIVFKYVPFLENEDITKVSIKTGISMPTLLKLKANSRPAYTTLMKLYMVGYDVMESFDNQEL